MIAALLVSWLAVTARCDGSALLTPVDHYEVQAFEARVVGSHASADGLVELDYERTTARNVRETSTDLEPGPGAVVGWDGMWDSAWRVTSPPVVAVTLAGARSDAPCD